MTRVDVVVADGFTGNVVLKTCRKPRLRHDAPAQTRTDRHAHAQVRRAALAKMRSVRIKRRLDPEVYGGAVLLGLNGIVIKAHGSARERAIMNAIRVAAEEVQHGVNQIIAQQIARANERLAAAESAAPLSRMSPHPPNPNSKIPAPEYNFQGRTCFGRRRRLLCAGQSADQCRPGKNGRDHRRMDHHPHRHQGTAHRREG